MNLPEELRRYFGIAAFRGRQQEVVRHLLDGGSALIVMATGEGKSLCYQLPALLLPGTTLVVSPLIALMEDQVQALQRRGIPAACIHSHVERSDREARLRDALQGRIKLLYVTPERFRVPGFLAQVRQLRVPLLAVDEAHCVSRWGHDFRPDYARLGEVRRQLGDPPVLAATATATPRVRQDILDSLRIPDAACVVTGIERPNLFLAVRELHGDDDKLARIEAVAREIGGPGIVYFALIRDLLQCEADLRRRGFAPIVYHGELGRGERARALQRFLDAPDALVLATNAFGMGVDKSDIRFLLHHQIPRDLESYYQEIGRAGRDGRGSLCELLYREADVAIQRDFVEWANPGADLVAAVAQHLATLGERLAATTVEDLRATFLAQPRRDGRIDTCLRLLEAAGCCDGTLGRDFVWRRTPERDEIDGWLPPAKRQRDLEGLLAIVRYARGSTCRRQQIHEYFGFDAPAVPCGSCDVCTAPEPWLAAHLPVERRAIATAPAPDDGELARGEFVQIDGLGLCEVLRVDGRRGLERVDVLLTSDLTRRRVDLRRERWVRVR